MLRREIPTLIGFFFGMTMVLNYFVPVRWFGTFAGDVQQWALIVVAFAYVLGGLNILGIHLNKIGRRGRDWPYSIVTVAALVVMVLFGVVPEDWGWGGGKEAGSVVLWLYDATYVPLQSTVFSLLAFYIASASFRAFRVRNWQATSLAITAVVVMLGAVPLTASIFDAVLGPGAGEQLTYVRSWIMEALQNSGKRAILIGVALGTISTAIKIILGIERPYGRD